jgi:hypothetical protein
VIVFAPPLTAACAPVSIDTQRYSIADHSCSIGMIQMHCRVLLDGEEAFGDFYVSSEMIDCRIRRSGDTFEIKQTQHAKI